MVDKWIERLLITFFAVELLFAIFFTTQNQNHTKLQLKMLHNTLQLQLSSCKNCFDIVKYNNNKLKLNSSRLFRSLKVVKLWKRARFSHVTHSWWNCKRLSIATSLWKIIIWVELRHFDILLEHSTKQQQSLVQTFDKVKSRRLVISSSEFKFHKFFPPLHFVHLFFWQKANTARIYVIFCRKWK